MGGSAGRAVSAESEAVALAASVGAIEVEAVSDGRVVVSPLVDRLGCGTLEALEGAAEAVGETAAEGLDGAWAAQTPAGETGAAGLPAAGTYRKPSASPSRSTRLEIPTLASRHEPPALATKTAQ